MLQWEKSHVRHRRPLSSVCPSVPVGTDSVTGSQDAQHNTRTLKPSGLLQPTLVWAHKKTRRAYFQRRLGNTPLKSTGETGCRSMFAAPRACLCVRWCESGWGGRGAVSLAAVSVLMERERERGGLQDPVCQQPACERHCRAEVHHWQMSKSPPSTPPFTPPFPSWSIFLFCLWAQRTQRPFKTATGKHIWSCCRQGRRSSSMLIYFTSTTVILLVWIWHVVL